MKQKKSRPSKNRIALLGCLLILISCATSKSISISNTEISNNFNNSFKTWNKQKKIHNNAYEYEVSSASWVGYRSTTKITVKNGKVVSRTFSENQISDNGRYYPEKMKEVYKESGSTVNTNERGAKGETLDQVYEVCGIKQLQVSEDENKLYFTTDDAGIIQSCGYTLKNCMDDCSTGVYIASFKWLE